MRFEYDAEQREFRSRLCAFLSAELTREARERHYDPDELGGWSVEFTQAFHRRLGAAGFIGASWPEEYRDQGAASSRDNAPASPGHGRRRKNKARKGSDPALDFVLVRELEYH